MTLSIVIPAFNEELELPACLRSVREAISRCGAEGEVEVIVCDNNSSDRTAEIAAAEGVRVVHEPVNQISRARNTGAAAAGGRWLLFIDADSLLEAGNLRRVLEIARAPGGPGAVVAGGCTISMGRLPLWARPLTLTWNSLSVLARWAAGSFLFCRRDAFQECGGFSHELYAAEEIDFSRRLKAWARQNGGRFVILRGRPHLSSSRKFRLYTFWETLGMFVRGVLRFRRTLRSRHELPYFYDGRRRR